jgi:branched-chain amino acid transport system permease protein
VSAGATTDPGGLAGLLYEHRVHAGVVLALALYPPVFGLLTNSPVGDELAVILPPMRTMVAVLYVGLFAMSFDFISGYTGYLSFGHGMFYGIGAYLVVLAATGKTGALPFVGPGTPFVVLLLVGGLLAGVAAFLIGAVSFRLTGVYFAMITLGFAEVGHVFVRNWDHVSSNPRTGASVGSDVPAFEIGVPYVDGLGVGLGQLVGTSVTVAGFEVSETAVSFYAVGLVVLLCYLAMQRIVHSPFGRVMIAIRENEERARAVGYNTFRYKLAAFAISGFFAAVAGGLFAGFRRSIAPETTFDLFVTADALLAAIIGGFGTLAGPLYGHLFHEFVGGVLSTESHGLARYLRRTLPENVLAADVGGFTLLDGINLLVDGRAELYLGLVFIAFVLYVPQGILGTIRERVGGRAAEHLPAHLRRYLRSLRDRHA